MTRYSLWQERWIPVLYPSGKPDTLSLRDALAEAHEVKEVFDPSPLVTVAVHRLLLVLLYRIFRPQEEAEWKDLWRARRFHPGRLDRYGSEAADRFDLFHPSRPFYQVPYMEEEKVHPISALVLEAASGNNPTLFDHGHVEGMEALPPGRAACHLVAHQAFAVGGGVSKPFNRMDAPLAKGLVVEARGGNLFETLMLNLMPLSWWASHVPDQGRDAPFWELGETPEPEREGTRPLGPMHYLSWQSRQIHLRLDAASGLITGCQIRQRYCLPEDGSRVDPFKPYRKSEEEGWLPIKVEKQRALWQFTHVLLQRTDADAASPYLTDWLAKLESDKLDVPPISMTISGLTRDPRKAAKIELWRREHLPIPSVLLLHPHLVGDLRDLILYARRIESLLRRTEEALVWALGERQQALRAVAYVRTGKVPAGKLPDACKSLAGSLGTVTRYWPALEGPFRAVLRRLSDSEEFKDIQEEWRRAVQGAAQQALSGVRDSLLHAQAPFEVLARIEDAFRYRLASLALERRKGGSPDDEEGSEG